MGVETDEVRPTHVVLRDERGELLVARCKVRTKSGSERSNEVTRRRDEDRVVLGGILGRFLFLVLVGILLARSLLLEDLDSDVREVIGTYEGQMSN